MGRALSVTVIALALAFLITGGARASQGAGASTGRGSMPSPLMLKRSPEYRRCASAGPALAAVADLHRVSFRTACRVMKKLTSRIWPESGWVKVNQYCSNDLGHVHEFDGWNVKVRGFKAPSTLSRNGRWFAFIGEEFPISCV